MIKGRRQLAHEAEAKLRKAERDYQDKVKGILFRSGSIVYLGIDSLGLVVTIYPVPGVISHLPDIESVEILGRWKELGHYFTGPHENTNRGSPQAKKRRSERNVADDDARSKCVSGKNNGKDPENGRHDLFRNR